MTKYAYLLCHTNGLLCAFLLQGDSRGSNGVHQGKKMSDAQLFDKEFDNLVSELTEQDFTDPVLSDALSRLKEVR